MSTFFLILVIYGACRYLNGEANQHKFIREYDRETGEEVKVTMVEDEKSAGKKKSGAIIFIVAGILYCMKEGYINFSR